MDDARQPVPTENPKASAPGRRRGVGLRVRLLAAILVVALTTVGVGLFGIQRMSVLSARADDVRTEGAVPLDQLRKLQGLWWEFQTWHARANIPALVAEAAASGETPYATLAAQSIQGIQQLAKTVDGAPLSPAARTSYREFEQNLKTFLTDLPELTQPTTTLARKVQLVSELSKAERNAVAALDKAVDAQAAVATTTADEAKSAYETGRALTLVMIAVGIAIALGVAFLVARGVTRPVQRIKEVLGRVAGGDLTVRAGHTGAAELGEMAESLDHTLDSIGEVLSLVGDSSRQLADASGQLTAVADNIARFSVTAADQSERVVASAGEVAASVDTVATGSSQMESAIREIAHNATEAARVAGQAVNVAEETTKTVGKLGDSSQEIATVVKLINGIAEQTNLLALNATIEAARAGEAGKGFAVVASEVKELAQETARATEDISKRVEAIQADTAGAVDAIGQISSVIAEINDFQATIAAAVEEQTATSNEMNRNVAEAANGTRDISTAIEGLATGTQETNARVSEAQAAASELARMSSALQEAVSRFTV